MQANLGQIEFINCLPLWYGLQQKQAEARVNIHFNIPARLNEALLAGNLQLSGVSSIVYAQNAKDLRIVPGLSISSFGGLESILLMSKYPIQELAGKRLGMTAKSATTQRLLKVLLKFAYHAEGKYEVTAQSVAQGVLNEYDAILLIGDDALYEYHHRQDGYYYYDLGQEWYHFTGLPMVFALWVMRRDFVEANPTEAQELGIVLRQCMDYGLLRLPESADFYRQHQPETPFLRETIVHYLQLLDYGWSKQHEAGLLKYYGFAAELGEIDHVPTLAFT